MSNKNLNKAKSIKNDEFYTQLKDIENEIKHYKKHLKNKTILCNCDDPEHSNFWKYFSLNFDHLNLKKLISTHYEKERPSYKLEMSKYGETIKTPLKQNGDFRGDECIEILKESDIVITNPPFSLFREYIEQLMNYNKEFIIVAPFNATNYKDTFSLIQNNDIWLGCTSPKEFIQPNGINKKFGNIIWLTNLPHNKRYELIPLYQKYSPDAYPKYDNFDAIEVSKVSNIPIDYDGMMGVPITFLDKYNPRQFKIIGESRYITGKCNDINYINGRLTFRRIIIQKIKG